MKALTWHGQRDVRVDDVTDPKIKEPTDAIVRITTTAICGSDLHLYDKLGAFLSEGDILGHEPMGYVEETGEHVHNLAAGDRVVVPFQIACGHCFMCNRGLQTQCETTQVHEQNMGAKLFGYTKLYGSVPGGQAEYLRVPQAHYGPIRVPEGPSDDRFILLSDVLPTAWQSVAYADVPPGGTVAVLGLGPIGDMACRLAPYHGAREVIALDSVPERLQRARQRGVTTIDLNTVDDPVETVHEHTRGRGADSVIDAVGMEAHGAPSPMGQLVNSTLGDQLARELGQAGSDSMGAFYLAADIARRGGTLSLIGVYGGIADPLPMLNLFDKQLHITQGQANVKRWIDEIMPLVTDESDPLGLESFATHHMPLSEAPHGYEIFQKKEDNAVKVLLNP
jgi:threonine dehydrogenase-like Zn-dependent dehydrogenase